MPVYLPGCALVCRDAGKNVKAAVLRSYGYGSATSEKSFSHSSAITSISTSTSFGKRATSTVERAGGGVLKYLP
jgi:hypothetical protein